MLKLDYNPCAKKHLEWLSKFSPEQQQRIKDLGEGNTEIPKLIKLKRNRKPVEVHLGDVFLVSNKQGLYFYGKVIRRGKLDKLLVHQIVKGNLPFPLPFKLQNLVQGGTADNSLAKGVVPALDIFLIGYLVGHGNSPSLNNSAGRQYSLLSPLDCLPAKAGGAVNGCAYAPFILTVDWLGWVCYLPDKLEFILSYHVLPS